MAVKKADKTALKSVERRADSWAWVWVARKAEQ